MPSLFSLIHSLLSFASKLNIFPSNPFSVKPYFTEDKANELGDEVGEFKSKIELAKECVEEAMKFFDIRLCSF